MERYLVTGGAGYVGSHTVLALLRRGAHVVVIDDLSLGHAAAIPPGAQLIQADASDPAALDAVLAPHRGTWSGVLHFAARSQVGESVAHPLRYLNHNAGGGMRLIEACIRHTVPAFVLSSTASVFGEPTSTPIAEDAPLRPSSPYGESKLMLERALHWASAAHGMRHACLRYFNAAGADPGGALGEDHAPETHLIPIAIDAALGRRGPLTVFGTDYPTPDGTCIRDYVHVSDLAAAHLLALDRLQHQSVTYNLGSGTGYSVHQVIAAVEQELGRKVPWTAGPRRPGDPAALVASSARIRAETGWTQRHPALSDMVATAAAWRLARPQGYRG